MEPAEVGAHFRAACVVELEALKPGNVHVHADGHGMTVQDFVTSADVVAPVMADPALAVGARIHEAVRRTRAAVACNTNLGIVLLCAPLAQAALSMTGGSLRARMIEVLDGLDRDDAERTFRAIALAEPAGLGASEEHDVHEPARVTLAEAMAFAAERDRIAWNYGHGFADIFELGLPRLRLALARSDDEIDAAGSIYLAFLAGIADTHIAREHGALMAETVRRDAEAFDRRLSGGKTISDLSEALLAFDSDLKSKGLNPGTSADLTVASLFARRLEDAHAVS